MPSAVATAAVIAVAYLILLVMGVLLLIAVSQFVGLLPQYADQLAATESQLVKLRSASSVWTRAAPRAWSPRSIPPSCWIWPAR